METEFSSKIKNSNGKEKYIKMKYELIDINNYSEQELLGKNTAISYVMLIEKRKEGKIEGIKLIVSNMIKSKLDIEKIKEYTGIEEDEIKKIAANM